MSRREELLNLVPEDSKSLVIDLVDEIVFLEERLKHLKSIPFIKVNPENFEQQKATPAAKLYKEFLQQYTNALKLIEAVIYRDKRLEKDEAEESPLRAWFKKNVDDGK